MDVTLQPEALLLESLGARLWRTLVVIDECEVTHPD